MATMRRNQVMVKYDDKYGDYWLSRGNGETFYDDERYLRTWATPQEAVDWLQETYPDLELVGVAEEKAVKVHSVSSTPHQIELDMKGVQDD